jgi:hypothetical protein
LGFMIWDLRFGIWNLEFMIWDLRFGIYDLEFMTIALCLIKFLETYGI